MTQAAHATTMRHRVQYVWKRRRREILPVIVASCVLLGGYLFWELAEQVGSGRTLAWDEWMLRAFRRSDDPTTPIGPHWLYEALLDATALGSPLILTFFIVASIGFLYFEGQKRVAVMTIVTAGGGALMSLWLKHVFARARPEVVPHLREVVSASFPSGHTMGAAVVYLTLGVMFMKSFRSRRAKVFCLFWALFLTLIVGASRVYLGVHYPSDVLGGWIAGLGWASACWSVSQFIPNRPLPETNDTPPAKA